MGAVPPRVRVLIVDDDALTRKLFAMVVRELVPEVEVVEAVGVAAARAKLPAKLVITDYRLADGSGADVLAAVRGSEIPDACVLAVTGIPGDEAKSLAHLGFDQLIFKPVDLEQLRAYCRRALT